MRHSGDDDAGETGHVGEDNTGIEQRQFCAVSP
jgi:hypothetical protein